MYCPKCVTEKAKVKKSHPLKKIRKRDRVCTFCGYVFTTWETLSNPWESNRLHDEIEQTKQRLRENIDLSP